MSRRELKEMNVPTLHALREKEQARSRSQVLCLFFHRFFLMHFMPPLVVKSNISSQQDSVLIATHSVLDPGLWGKISKRLARV